MICEIRGLSKIGLGRKAASNASSLHGIDGEVICVPQRLGLESGAIFELVHLFVELSADRQIANLLVSWEPLDAELPPTSQQATGSHITGGSDCGISVTSRTDTEADLSARSSAIPVSSTSLYPENRLLLSISRTWEMSGGSSSSGSLERPMAPPSFPPECADCCVRLVIAKSRRASMRNPVIPKVMPTIRLLLTCNPAEGLAGGMAIMSPSRPSMYLH